jgi:GNAT superfamily N-acetyltransferase
MSDAVMRRATPGDLPAIVALLADDGLGRGREDPRLPLAQGYRDAFAAIEADPNHMLVVAEREGQVVGTLQLSFIPGLSRQGMWRGQVEAVRIAAGARGTGLGQAMMEWAIAACRQRGCGLVQLTTDKARQDAHRFYDRLGFQPSHLGYKLTL